DPLLSLSLLLFFFFMLRRPPLSTLFPYTTLFDLIYLEPDLGTALSYVVIWFAMLVAAGARPLYLGGFALCGLLTAPLGWLLLRRSEEHTSELQSRGHLVCRLLLEKKKPINDALAE